MRFVCPNCRLVELKFTRKPSGARTAWCWVCGRGYYLAGRKVHDISIKCQRLGKIVPAYFCRECPQSAECLREIWRRKITEPLTFEVKPEVIIHA